MDQQHLIDLHRRIAGLEAEKAYLVHEVTSLKNAMNCMVSSLSYSQQQGAAAVDTAIKQIQSELAWLRAKQEQWQREQSKRGGPGVSGLHTPPSTEKDVQQQGGCHLLDLVDIGKTTSHPAAVTKLSPVSKADWDLVPLEPALSQEVTYRNADGDIAYIPQLTTVAKPAYNKPYVSTRVRTPQQYHQRLLNIACFTEDVPEHDRDQYWTELAQKYGLHDGGRLRSYYEQHVRPIYLERRAAIKTSDLAREAANPAHRSTSVSTVDICFEGKHIQLEYEDQALAKTANDDKHEHVTQDAAGAAPPTPNDQNLKLPEASKDEHVTQEVLMPSQLTISDQKPSLLGNAKQLEEARMFSQSATKGRSRAQKHSHQVSMNNHVATVDERRYPSTDAFHNDEDIALGRNASVLLTGIPAYVAKHTVLRFLKPNGMVLVRFAETAGMKTKPPMVGNTVLFVFHSDALAVAFCEMLSNNAVALYKFYDKTFPLTVSRFAKESQILPHRLSNLVHRGVTCAVIVENDEKEWKAEQLLDLINNISIKAVTAVTMADKENGEMHFVFGSILQSWYAHNIIIDHAELTSTFVNPWNQQQDDIKAVAGREEDEDC